METRTPTLLVIKDARVDSIMSSFVQEDRCIGCIYEIYIDKQDPHFYELVLYKGKNSLTLDENRWSEQNALQKVKVDDVFFDVFSGVEHYFSAQREIGSSNLDHSDSSDDNLRNNYEGTVWVIKDQYGEIEIEKVEHKYPFIPGPKKEIIFPEKNR